jgi:hypothetical protein
MFNPFFTTKPAGEGTGLGLSITHDIIVKQHSGSIDLNTQPGEFTEMRIIHINGLNSVSDCPHPSHHTNLLASHRMGECEGWG